MNLGVDPSSGRVRMVTGVVALAVVGLQLILVVTHLESLPYNPDEGHYIQTALEIQAGGTPMVDFLIQQPPAYVYLLAMSIPEGSRSLFDARWLSLAAHAAAIVMLWVWLRRRAPQIAASAVVLYALPALQVFSWLAMPYALMNALIIAAWILFDRSTWIARIGSATLLWAAWLVRPLALTAMVGFGAVSVLEFVRRRERRVPAAVFMLTGVALIVPAWAWLQHVSDGRFIDLVVAQWAIRSSTAQLDVWMDVVYGQRIFSSSAEWALVEHGRVWLHWSTYRFFPVGLLLLGFGVLGRDSRGAGIPPPLRQAALALLFVAALFNLGGLWGGPVWDHYSLLYMAPWALIGAAPMAALANWRAADRRWGLALWLGAVGALFVAPVLPPHEGDVRRLPHYERMRSLGADSTPIFTLDPIVHFVSGRPAACLDQWIEYGPINSLHRLGIKNLSRLIVSEQELIDCLARQPEVQVVITEWSRRLMRPALKAYLRTVPERVRCLPDPADLTYCLRDWPVTQIFPFP